MILTIDTSGGLASICLASAATAPFAILAHEVGEGLVAEALLGAVEAALAQRGASRAALSGIACALGPGPFTATRVGIATAQGIAHALDLPAIGVGTLHAAFAAYKLQGETELLSQIAKDASRGEAFVLDREDLHAAKGARVRMIPQARVDPAACWIRVDPSLAAPSIAASSIAAGVARRAHARLSQGERDPLDQLLPDYVREPDAKLPSAR